MLSKNQVRKSVKKVRNFFSNRFFIPTKQMLTKRQKQLDNRIDAVKYSLQIWKKYYSLRILTKNRKYVAGYLLISLVVGMLLPKDDTYIIINSFGLSKMFPNGMFALLAILLFFANYWIIRQTMVSQYALPRQAVISTWLATIILLLVASIGFVIWLYVTRINLCTTEIIKICINSVRRQVDILSATVTVFGTFAIFSGIYGYVLGPFSKVNYIQLHYRLSALASIIEIISRKRLETNINLLHKEMAELEKLVQESFADLDEIVPYEIGDYGKFIASELYNPLKGLKKFMAAYNIRQNPTNYKLLVKEVDEVKGVGNVQKQFFTLKEFVNRL